MKKILAVFLTLPFILFFGCSDDDDDKIDHRIPAENEIKIVFEANSDNPDLEFYLEGKDVTIDWGDGEKLNEATFDDYAKHNYQNTDREYIVTIQASEIENFGNTTDVNVTRYIDKTPNVKIKEILFGNKVDITNLNIQLSRISSLTVPETSEFEFIHVLINNPNFDLTLLRDFRSITRIYITGEYDLQIDNFESTILVFNLKKNILAGSININSCPNLSSLYVRPGDYDGFKNLWSGIKNLKLTNVPKLSKLELSYIRTEEIDISEALGPIQFGLYYSDAKKSIKFNDYVKDILITEFSNEYFSSNTKTLDLSVCENLEILRIGNMENLEEIKFGKIDKLEIITLDDCYKIKTLDLSDMAGLTDFNYNCLKRKGEVESLDISGCPALDNLNISNNSVKSFNWGENYSLSSIGIVDNNLDENALLKMFELITDLPLPDKSKTRSLSISGNPGITDKVKEAADKLKYWKVYY